MQTEVRIRYFMESFKKLLFLILLIFFTTIAFSQGNYAGEFKSLIGRKYVLESEIIALKGFSFQQGSVIGDVNSGPFLSTISVFKKNKTRLVIVSKIIDIDTKMNRIIEIMQFSTIDKKNEIRISDCYQKPKNKNQVIVAMVFSGPKRKVKTILKAYILKDIRFEKIPTKNIICINEGFE